MKKAVTSKQSSVGRKLRKEVPADERTKYAQMGRGKNAFVPRKTKKRDILQERIDMVVAKAKKRESKTDYDVIRHVNAPLRFTNAHKIG